MVIFNFFDQRVGNTLINTSVNLAFRDHGIDQAARILGDHQFLKRDLSGFDIDCHDGDVAPIRKSPGRIVSGALAQARRELPIEMMNLMIGSARQGGDRDFTVRTGDPRNATFQHDIIRRSLEKMSGHDTQLCADLAGRQQGRAARDHQRAARKGAEAVRRAIGVAMNDLDPLRRDPQFVGDDLGERGAQALAMGRGADTRLDKARRVHGKLDGFPAERHLHAARRECRRSVAGTFRECRNAEPEMAAGPARLRLMHAKSRQVDGRGRHLQGFRISGFIEGKAGRRRVRKCSDQVAAAHFDGLDPQRGCRLVHQPFHRQRDDRPRHAAIGRHRAGVGRHPTRAARIFLHIIGTR